MPEPVQIDWTGFPMDQFAAALVQAQQSGASPPPASPLPAPPPGQGGSPVSTAPSNVSAGGGGGSSLDPTEQKSTTNFVAAAATFAEGQAVFARDTFDNSMAIIDSIENSGVIASYTQIQDRMGFSVDAYGKLNEIHNEFTRSEVENYQKMQQQYSVEGSLLSNFYESDTEMLNDYGDLLSKMNDLNHRALDSFDTEERQRALIFQKNMGLVETDIMELMNRSYAFTGETSTEVLNNIAAHAKEMSELTGIGFKDLSQEMAGILTDTDFFGKKTEAFAARLGATYRQLGIDLQTAKGVIDKFRSFDDAAKNMGDLSAMFGIQMDAMEMMYLANEDEEEFLHQLRGQMLDQGIDVENMSNTRMRALQDQLGMSRTQLETFFRDGEMVADQADMEEASNAAAQMGIEETNTLVEKQALAVRRNAEEWGALNKHHQTFKNLDVVDGYAELTAEASEMSVQMNTLRADIPVITDGIMSIQDALGAVFSQTGEYIEEGDGFLLDMLDPSKIEPVMGPYLEKIEGSAKEGWTRMTTDAEGVFGADSLPPWLESLGTGLDWVANSSESPVQRMSAIGETMAINLTEGFSSTIETEFTMLMESIPEMLTELSEGEAFTIPVAIDVAASNAGEAAPFNPADLLKVDPSAAIDKIPENVRIGLESMEFPGMNLESLDLEAALSAGMSESVEQISTAISEIPGSIQSAIETLNVESQNTEKVNTASMIAENMEFNNSKSFMQLAEALKTMSTDNKLLLTKVVTALTDNRTIDVDILLDSNSIGKAMKSYEPQGSGSRFAIQVGD